MLALGAQPFASARERLVALELADDAFASHRGAKTPDQVIERLAVAEGHPRAVSRYSRVRIGPLHKACGAGMRPQTAAVGESTGRRLARLSGGAAAGMPDGDSDWPVVGRPNRSLGVLPNADDAASAIRASFSARVRRLKAASARRALERSGCGQRATTATGRRARVYFAPRPD
jgi:hypothetical protein